MTLTAPRGRGFTGSNKSLYQEVIKPDPDGGVRRELKESHYSSMLRQYYGHFRMYAKEFGLTPVGRVGLKVNTGKEEEDNHWDDIS